MGAAQGEARGLPSREQIELWQLYLVCSLAAVVVNPNPNGHCVCVYIVVATEEYMDVWVGRRRWYFKVEIKRGLKSCICVFMGGVAVPTRPRCVRYGWWMPHLR